jgi:uncharacterized protein (TIGR03118 family)
MPCLALLAGAILGLAAPPAGATAFEVVPLVSDRPGAAVTDPNLKNPWGISYSPTGPFWVSDNGSGFSTLYRVTGATAVAAVPLVVTIPGDGSVTGQVFNTGTANGAFNRDNFLFVSEDGTINGWRGALGTVAEVLKLADPNNVYKGAALNTTGLVTTLFAANFRTGTIDAFAGAIANPVLGGKFVDPSLPAGYAPFNIQLLGGKLYVAYAEQDLAKHDEVAGPGKGYVDAFDLAGNFLARVGSGGPLDAPWGLAIAPASFGQFAGDLLVGNFGDGRINAYNLATDSFVGQLTGLDGAPLVIDGLWGLTPGNGGGAGSPQTLYFTAGPNGEANGLFGALVAVPEPASGGLLIVSVLALTRLRQTPRKK